MDNIISLIFFILLSLLLIATGVAYRKKSNTADGFLLGSRSLNSITGAASTYSTTVCAYSLLVLSALSFSGADGAQTAIFYGAAICLGLFLSWRFLARRMRVYSEVSENSRTIPSFLENRFKGKTPVMKITSSAVLCGFSAVYCAFMFTACAQLFAAAVNCSYSLALIVCSVVVMLYLLFGGFLASAFTDVLQGFLILIVLFFLPFYMFEALDVGSRVTLEGEFLQTLDLFKNGENFGLNTLNGVFIMLGCFGLPQILSVFMSMRDKRQIKRAKRFVPLWASLCVLLSVVAGLFLRRFLALGSNISVVFITAVSDPFMRALLFSAIMAAFMSAAGSQLHQISSVLSNDIYPYFRKKPSSAETVTVARASMVALTFCICLLSLNNKADISKLFLYSFSGLSASFAPSVFFGLYSRRITLRGAVASIVTGALSTVLLWFIPMPSAWLSPIAVSMLLSVAALWLVSIVDRNKPGKDILNEFSRVNEIMKLR